MAKKIKFPLKLKDDFQVRTLDELKEHFDLDKIVAYFLDGKLLTWLKDRYYDVEVDAIRNLQKDDPELQKKLCQIFGMEYSDYQLDINEVEERNRRLGILRQFTSDPTVLEQVASVAFNQEDLGDLLDDGVQKIFLCNNSFVIPLSIEDKTYIGIGKTIAVIRSTEKVDFDSKHISFQDISFDPDYQKLIDAEIIVPPAPQKDFYQLGKDAENNGDYNSAIDFYLKALEENNNADVNSSLGWCYEKINDFVKAYPYYLKAANLGNIWAMNNLSGLFFNGQGVSQNYAKGREWLEKAADNGNEHSRYWMGRYIFYGQFGYSKDLYKGKQIIEQAAYNGNVSAMLFLGGRCKVTREKNIHDFSNNPTADSFYKCELICDPTSSVRSASEANECAKWYLMAADNGNLEAIFQLGFLYYKHSYFDSDLHLNEKFPRIVFSLNGEERFKWIEKGASLGRTECMLELAIAYSNGKLFNGSYFIRRADGNSYYNKYYYEYFPIEKSSKKSLEWLIKFLNIEQNIDNGQFKERGISSERLLDTIYEGDPDLFNDIKKRFHWYHIGISGKNSLPYVTSISYFETNGH